MVKRKLFDELVEGLNSIVERKYPGPFGCKCQSFKEHVTGDGCDECNTDYMKDIDNEA